MFTSRIESRYPPAGEFVTHEDAKLHVISEGQGQPVLFVHGASANAREFTFTLAPEMDTSQFALLMADRPGHGYSEPPENPHSLKAQAAAMSAIKGSTRTRRP